MAGKPLIHIDNNHTCPNTATSEKDCSGGEKFFCQESKSCIDLTQTCDGIVHCIRAEDEDWDLCKSKFKFDETATIECNQTKRGSYDLLIKGIPCSGECKNETCEQDKKVLKNAIGFSFLVIISICAYIHIKITKKYPAKAFDPPEKIDQETANSLRGDSLVEIKVTKFCTYYAEFLDI